MTSPRSKPITSIDELTSSFKQYGGLDDLPSRLASTEYPKLKEYALMLVENLAEEKSARAELRNTLTQTFKEIDNGQLELDEKFEKAFMKAFGNAIKKIEILAINVKALRYILEAILQISSADLFIDRVRNKVKSSPIGNISSLTEDQIQQLYPEETKQIAQRTRFQANLEVSIYDIVKKVDETISKVVTIETPDAKIPAAAASSPTASPQGNVKLKSFNKLLAAIEEKIEQDFLGPTTEIMISLCKQFEAQIVEKQLAADVKTQFLLAKARLDHLKDRLNQKKKEVGDLVNDFCGKVRILESARVAPEKRENLIHSLQRTFDYLSQKHIRVILTREQINKLDMYFPKFEFQKKAKQPFAKAATAITADPSSLDRKNITLPIKQPYSINNPLEAKVDERLLSLGPKKPK